MNTNTLDFFALILLLILFVILPLFSFWDFRRLIRWTEEGRLDARIKTYNEGMIMQWGLTSGLLLLWYFVGRDWALLRLMPQAEGWQWLAIGLGLAASLISVFQMRKVLNSPEELTKIRESMGNLSILAPQTPQENRLFNMLSITAAVCEEILYRGLLMAVLIPVMGTWPAVILSSLIFGLAHAYQGLLGIGKTAFVGFIMALLTVFSGSLFIAILLHAIIDITSGKMTAASMSAKTIPE